MEVFYILLVQTSFPIYACNLALLLYHTVKYDMFCVFALHHATLQYTLKA